MKTPDKFYDGGTEAYIDAARQPSLAPETSFRQNFEAAWRYNRVTNLSVSQMFNDVEAQAWARDEVYRLTGVRMKNKGGQLDRSSALYLPSTSTNWYLLDRSYDKEKAFWGEIQELQKKFPNLRLPTPEHLQKWIADRAERLRKEQDVVAQTAGFWGDVGSFGGSMAAFLSDPPIGGTMFMGAGASVGLLRAMAIEAGIAGATEAALQPAVQGYRASIGQSASFGEGLLNVSFAAVGGAGGIAAFRGIGFGVRGSYGAAKNLIRKTPPNSQERHAAQHIIDAGDDLKTGPQARASQMADDAHIANLESSYRHVIAGTTPPAPRRPALINPTLRDSASPDVLNALGRGGDTVFDAGGEIAGAFREIFETTRRITRQLQGEDIPLSPIKRLDEEVGHNQIYRIGEDGRLEKLDPTGKADLRKRVRELAEEHLDADEALRKNGTWMPVQRLIELLEARGVPVIREYKSPRQAVVNQSAGARMTLHRSGRNIDVVMKDIDDDLTDLLIDTLEVLGAKESGIRRVNVSVLGEGTRHSKSYSIDEALRFTSAKRMFPDHARSKADAPGRDVSRVLDEDDPVPFLERQEIEMEQPRPAEAAVNAKAAADYEAHHKNKTPEAEDAETDEAVAQIAREAGVPDKGPAAKKEKKKKEKAEKEKKAKEAKPKKDKKGKAKKAKEEPTARLEPEEEEADNIFDEIMRVFDEAEDDDFANTLVRRADPETGEGEATVRDLVEELADDGRFLDEFDACIGKFE